MLKTIFDPDGTHDRLFAQRVDQTIINLIANALGNHSFFVGGESLPIALIERTERDISWAKDWTSTCLELLKKLSLTFILNDGYLNGSAYGFDPEYQANFPNSLNLGTFPEFVTLTVSPGQRVSLTYLERSHDVPSAPYCAQVVNKISCWHLRQREYQAPDSEALKIEIDCREVLFNSMVISKGASINKGSDLLLYSKLDKTLEKIYNQLNISACKVITQFEIVQPFSISVSTDEFEFASRSFTDETQSSELSYIEPVFSPVPDWFHFAALEFGSDKAPLGNGISWRKIGESDDIFAQVWYLGDKVDQPYDLPLDRISVGAFLNTIWPEGYMSVGVEGVPYTTRLKIEDILESLAAEIEFGAVGQKVDRPVGYWGVNSLSFERGLFDGRNTGQVLMVSENGAWKLQLQSGDLTYQAGAEVTKKQRLNSTIRTGYYVFGNEAFSDYRLRYDDFLYSIHQFYPPQLIKNSVNWFNNNICRVRRRPSDADWFRVIAKCTYNNTFSNGGITYTPQFEQYTLAGESFTAPAIYFRNFSFVVSVNFWDTPPEPYQIFSPETLTEIAEALDPDPDNGDIMPDSQRIIEIHQALEADTYAKHPQEPDKRTAKTLARLIDSAAYVLGININADGANVPYPDPQLLKPDKIAEINSKKILRNAQFAIANINGQFDSSSIYEVRSPIINTETGKKTIDHRPHAVKYHNLPQLLDAVADDSAKMMGGGKNSIFQVPNANGDDFQQYEGMYQALADSLYMLSAHSKAINELQNQSIKTVYMLSQILKALGNPCHVEKIEGVSGVYDSKGKEIPGYLAVPGIDAKSPTLVGLLGIVLMNLQRVVGSSIGFRTDGEPEDESKPGSLVTIAASPLLISAKNGGTVTFTVTRAAKSPEAKEEKIFVNLMLNSTLGKGEFSGGFKPGLWSLDMAAGETSKSFSVTVEKNEERDENHSITVVLSGGEGYELGVIKTATVAITQGAEKTPEKEPELNETDWLLEFETPAPKPPFTPDPEE